MTSIRLCIRLLIKTSMALECLPCLGVRPDLLSLLWDPALARNLLLAQVVLQVGTIFVATSFYAPWGLNPADAVRPNRHCHSLTLFFHCSCNCCRYLLLHAELFLHTSLVFPCFFWLFVLIIVVFPLTIVPPRPLLVRPLASIISVVQSFATVLCCRLYCFLRVSYKT